MRLSYAVIAPIVSALAHATMLLILARGAPASAVAQILSLQVAIALAYTVIELGIGRELSIAAAKGPPIEFRFLNRVHVFGLGSTALVAIGAMSALGLGFIPIMIVIYCAAERRITACSGASIASGRISYSATVLIVGRIIGLASLVALSITTSTDTAVLYSVVIAASSTLLALALSTIPRPAAGSGSERRSFREMLSVSMHYWATTLMGQARMLDVAIVSAILPLGTAASYALPARALQPLRIVGTSMANVAFPLAARDADREIAKLLKIACIASGAGALLIAALFPFLHKLVPLILGDEYRNSVIPIAIFALGAAVNLPGAVLSAILQAKRKQRIVTLLGLGLLVYQTTALAVVTIFYGVIGAAAVVLSTYIIQLLFVAIYYRKNVHA